MHPATVIIQLFKNLRQHFCHSQAKLKLKAKLGWLDYQLEAATAVLFKPGAFKPGALNPVAPKSARDIKLYVGLQILDFRFHRISDFIGFQISNLRFWI